MRRAWGGEGGDGGVFVEEDAGAEAEGAEGGDELGDVDLAGGATKEGTVGLGGELGVGSGEVGRGEELHRGVGVGKFGPVLVGVGSFQLGVGFGFGGIEKFEPAEAAEGDGKSGAGGDLGGEGFKLPKGFAVELLERAIGERTGGPECAEGGQRCPLAGSAGFEEFDLGTGGGEPPGTGKPHNPPADDEDFHFQFPVLISSLGL